MIQWLRRICNPNRLYTNQATNAIVTSELKTITGFTGSLPVSVGGQGNPQYSIGGGAYTNAPGNISDGQTLRVRHTSSSAASTGSRSSPRRRYGQVKERST